MRLLRWECWCAVIAFVLTLAFVLVPGPYEMAIFTFLAQPLFAIAAVSYLLKVFADLRRRGVVQLTPARQAGLPQRPKA